jgi:putative peptidoglycan lipid II flippase
MVTLAKPMVRVVYERREFTPEASELVASVLMAYAVGMFVYLGRDVLVRVFYALGDGDTPFRISIVNIFLNAVFDFLLVGSFGAPGVVLATVSVNVISVFALLWFLNQRLNGLPLQQWAVPIFGLMFGSAIAGVATWGTLQLTQRSLGSAGFLINLVHLAIAGSVGVLVFAMIATQLRIPEVALLSDRIRQKVLRR